MSLTQNQNKIFNYNASHQNVLSPPIQRLLAPLNARLTTIEKQLAEQNAIRRTLQTEIQKNAQLTNQESAITLQLTNIHETIKYYIAQQQWHTDMVNLEQQIDQLEMVIAELVILLLKYQAEINNYVLQSQILNRNYADLKMVDRVVLFNIVQKQNTGLKTTIEQTDANYQLKKTENNYKREHIRNTQYNSNVFFWAFYVLVVLYFVAVVFVSPSLNRFVLLGVIALYPFWILYLETGIMWFFWEGGYSRMF